MHDLRAPASWTPSRSVAWLPWPVSRRCFPLRGAGRDRSRTETRRVDRHRCRYVRGRDDEQRLGFLTDYDQMAEFPTNLTSSGVIRRESNTLQVAQSGHTKVAFMTFAFSAVRDIELSPTYEIRSSLVSGDFKSYLSTTRITDTQTGVRITHRSEAAVSKPRNRGGGPHLRNRPSKLPERAQTSGGCSWTTSVDCACERRSPLGCLGASARAATWRQRQIGIPNRRITSPSLLFPWARRTELQALCVCTLSPR